MHSASSWPGQNCSISPCEESCVAKGTRNKDRRCPTHQICSGKDLHVFTTSATAENIERNCFTLDISMRSNMKLGGLLPSSTLLSFTLGRPTHLRLHLHLRRKSIENWCELLATVFDGNNIPSNCSGDLQYGI